MEELATVPYGYCHCGCGGKTALRRKNNKQLGHVKGEPCDFIGNHGVRSNLKKGTEHHKWNGGRKVSRGYIQIWDKDHPRADGHGYVFEHIIVAESINGGPLPDGAEVHHIDGNKSNNLPSNLMILPNHAEHMALHLRERALLASGNPSFRKCPFCKQYDDPANMVKNQYSYLHKSCRSAAYKNYIERSPRHGRTSPSD